MGQRSSVVEQLTRNEQVNGSNPFAGSISLPRFSLGTPVPGLFCAWGEKPTDTHCQRCYSIRIAIKIAINLPRTLANCPGKGSRALPMAVGGRLSRYRLPTARLPMRKAVRPFAGRLAAIRGHGCPLPGNGRGRPQVRTRSASPPGIPPLGGPNHHPHMTPTPCHIRPPPLLGPSGGRLGSCPSDTRARELVLVCRAVGYCIECVGFVCSCPG